jgi:hypothetical protein
MPDAQLETRHYIGVTPMGRLHMTLGPDEPSKFKTPPHEPLTLENGSVLFLVSAEVAEEWDMDDEDDA